MHGADTEEYAQEKGLQACCSVDGNLIETIRCRHIVCLNERRC